MGMKRRSFIQGIAGIFGASAVVKEVRVSDFSEMDVIPDDSHIYEISPLDDPPWAVSSGQGTTVKPEWVEDELTAFNSDSAVQILEQRLANLQSDIDAQLKGA